MVSESFLSTCILDNFLVSYSSIHCSMTEVKDLISTKKTAVIGFCKIKVDDITFTCVSPIPRRPADPRGKIEGEGKKHCLGEFVM